MKDRIKQIRKDRKMTQEAFGKVLGVKGNTITNYENGMRNPSDAIITSICREFNVSDRWLRTGEGDMYNQSDNDDVAEIVSEILEADSPIKNSIICIVKAYMQLDEPSKKIINGFIDELHKNNREGD